METDYFECNVYTNEELGKREQVKSGDTAEFRWDHLEPQSVYYWYIIVEDSFNGKTKSPIWKFKTKKRHIVQHQTSLIFAMSPILKKGWRLFL